MNIDLDKLRADLEVLAEYIAEDRQPEAARAIGELLNELTRQAAPEVPTLPIYQVYSPGSGGWGDTTAYHFERAPHDKRRIVYSAPATQQATPAAPRLSDAAVVPVAPSGPFHHGAGIWHFSVTPAATQQAGAAKVPTLTEAELEAIAEKWFYEGTQENGKDAIRDAFAIARDKLATHQAEANDYAEYVNKCAEQGRTPMKFNTFHNFGFNATDFAETTTASASGEVKDHELRELVNTLRDIAVQFRDTQQLRARIHNAVLPLFRRAPSPSQSTPSADVSKTAPGIKTWRERIEEQYARTAPHEGDQQAAMLDEIADLRAALAQQGAAHAAHAGADITDEQILAAMRPHMMEADGGYACDIAPQHVIAGVRAVLAVQQENNHAP